MEADTKSDMLWTPYLRAPWVPRPAQRAHPRRESKPPTHDPSSIAAEHAAHRSGEKRGAQLAPGSGTPTSKGGAFAKCSHTTYVGTRHPRTSFPRARARMGLRAGTGGRLLSQLGGQCSG
eukprot:scaffold1603_cov415-Prasinococcus_capsulatus_cf.AAC.6